jgi:protein involved in polysaccharide export with SLBB domain
MTHKKELDKKENSMVKYSLAGVFLLALTVSSVASTIEGQLGNQQIIPTNVTLPEYRLGYGDVIEIKFFNNERFNETVTIRPDGRISMERMGEIFVAGITPVQLDELITLKYSEFIQDPEVTVFVREFSGYQVYVLGEVQSPGGFPIQRNMTLLQAIASAGGAKNGAKLGDVVLLRRGENGEVAARKVDLKKAMKTNNGAIGEYDLYIQPLDIVFVPKTKIASISSFMDMVYDGFLPPVDLYMRWLWWSRLD